MNTTPTTPSVSYSFTIRLSQSSAWPKPCGAPRSKGELRGRRVDADPHSALPSPGADCAWGRVDMRGDWGYRWNTHRLARGNERNLREHGKYFFDSRRTAQTVEVQAACSHAMKCPEE